MRLPNHFTPRPAPSPPPRMTAEEFERKQTELLAQLPEEFRGGVSFKAWQDGHSAGFEEVILHITELVDMLLQPIKEYTARLQNPQK